MQSGDHVKVIRSLSDDDQWLGRIGQIIARLSISSNFYKVKLKRVGFPLVFHQDELFLVDYDDNKDD